jgi:hypothetical protein
LKKIKKNSSNISIIALSLIIHLVVLAIWWALKPTQLISPSKRHISILIHQASKEKTKDNDQENIEIPKNKELVEKLLEEPIELIKKVVPLPDPNLLPHSYNIDDEVESSNQEDKSVNEIKSGSNVATEKKKVAEQVGGGIITSDSESLSTNVQGSSKDEDILKALGGVYNAFTGYDDETNNSQGEEESGLKSINDSVSDKHLENESDDIGNYSLLTDVELGDAFVKDPFSEKRGNELKLINIYIKQITDVIFSNWTNPLNPSEIKEGASIRIKFKLNESGFIEEPRLLLQSRYSKLDSSLLLAIKNSMVYQFDIPKSYLEKYSYLTLSWSSDGSEYELMPFQKETEKEK